MTWKRMDVNGKVAWKIGLIIALKRIIPFKEVKLSRFYQLLIHFVCFPMIIFIGSDESTFILQN